MIIEQAELRDSARKLLLGTVGAKPDEAWNAAVEAGWPALMAPEELGGLEQKLAASCWLYLELGHALSPLPLLPSLLAVEALRACAPSPARDEWIERIAAGERIAVSLLDPVRDHAAAGDDAGGSLQAVLGADRARHVLVIRGDEPLIAVMPLDQGAEVVPRPTWDTTRGLSDLRFDERAVDEGVVIARGEAARAGVVAFATHLHVAIAADCVGAAQAILAETVTHLKTRRQFDRPLAMFQALKHRCADLTVSVQAAEALLADYMQDIDGDRHDEGMLLARAAKSLASATFRAVAEDAMQLHGGIGMAAEHSCHLYLKRALLNEQLATPDDLCDLAVGRAFVAARAS